MRVGREMGDCFSSPSSGMRCLPPGLLLKDDELFHVFVSREEHGWSFHILVFFSYFVFVRHACQVSRWSSVTHFFCTHRATIWRISISLSRVRVTRPPPQNKKKISCGGGRISEDSLTAFLGSVEDLSHLASRTKSSHQEVTGSDDLNEG